MRSCRGSGAKAKVRPIPGNAPHDRLVSRGTQSPRSVCDDSFPVTPFLQLQRTLRPQRAFFKAWRNLSGPMGFQNQKQKQKQKQNQTLGRDQTASRWSAPHPGKRTRREDHALSHRPQMSSGRLFLDRVARQHCPSPLHRHTQNNTHPAEAQAEGDISTLPGNTTFLFCLDSPKIPVDRTHRTALRSFRTGNRRRAPPGARPAATRAEKQSWQNKTRQIKYLPRCHDLPRCVFS
jgi:hypothetical protein